MDKIEAASIPDFPAPRKVQVRVIVSRGKESLRTRAMLSGLISTGDEIIVDDEKTGEAILVRVTSVEAGDKRIATASAEDIKTIWARAIDEVVVKIAVNLGEVTESLQMKVPGDREFIIGEKVKVDDRELKILRIKIREGGFKSRKGIAIRAADIKRIYADSGVKKLKGAKRKGGRILIKKRESVWSLKTKRTS